MNVRLEERQPSDVVARSTEDALQLLMMATASGCSASFAKLYSRTHRRLFGVVLRVVHHRGEAEEVVQEVYLKVWASRHLFDPGRGLVLLWLTAIAHRAAIDCRRRSSARASELHDGSDDEASYDSFEAPGSGPPELLESAQQQRLVRGQLQLLSGEQKESVVLAFIDGLSHAEIAAKLSCPLGTIKSRVRRAMLSMRPSLQALV